MRHRVLALLLVFCALCTCSVPGWAANTHSRPDVLGEMQSWFGDSFRAYVLPNDCTPAVPASSLTFAAFACHGYIRSSVADLVYVSQAARSVGPLSGGNGTYWLAVHRDTSTAVGGWTRQTSTHYLWQKSATKPATPANGLIFLRVVVAGGVITDRTLVAPTTPLLTSQDCLNVQDLGANPDDAVDDTAAFLAAIAAIPGTSITGAHYTDKGAGCIVLPLPTTDTGGYLVSSNLNLTEKFNLRIVAPAPAAFSRNASPFKSLIKWTGGTNGRVFLLDVNLGVIFENISIDCGGSAGTVGFALGADGSATSLVNAVEIRNPVVRNCDIGIRLGDNPNGGPNIANNNIYNPILEFNKSGGIVQRSGNGVNTVHGSYIVGNGTAPVAPQTGGNVEIQGGQLAFDGYTSGGGAAGTTQPLVADIIVGGGAVTITGQCWSDTYGVFLNGGGGNSQASSIGDCRHFAAGMTDTNTPNSIIWASAHPLVLTQGYYFSNIQVNTGNNSHVIPLGTRFHYGSPHTTVTPTFTGSALTGAFYALGGFTGAGITQRPVLALGRPYRADTGNTAAQITTDAREPFLAACTTDAAVNNCGTMGYQASVGGWNLFGNAYYDGASGTVKSVSAGEMTWIRAQASGTNTIYSFYRDTAASAGLTKFAPGTAVFEFVYDANGVGNGVALKLGGHLITWGTGPPSQGAHTQGDVVINTASALGQPRGWQATVTGTPGTWVALPTLSDLSTTGAAGGKKVVCVDTANGRLYASSTTVDCSN